MAKFDCGSAKVSVEDGGGIKVTTIDDKATLDQIETAMYAVYEKDDPENWKDSEGYARVQKSENRFFFPFHQRLETEAGQYLPAILESLISTLEQMEDVSEKPDFKKLKQFQQELAHSEGQEVAV